MRKTLIVLSALILVTVGAPARAGYTFTPISIPGSVSTNVYGINNAGVASGYYYDGINFHGFLAANGAVQTIDAPGALDTGGTFVFAGNPSGGRFAGTYYDTNNGQLATVYDSGTKTWTNYNVTLPDGASLNAATAVNDRGQLFGNFYSAGGPTQGWVYQNGMTTVFDPPRDILGINTNGANNAGDVVGGYTDGVGYGHGFIYHASTGTFSYYDVPGAQSTALWGIDDLGDIVGAYSTALNSSHGFLLSHTGSLTTVDYPGAAVSFLTGINDAGQLVGQWGSGPANSFIATPTAVPEPSSWALMLSACGLTAVRMMIGKIGRGRNR